MANCCAGPEPHVAEAYRCSVCSTRGKPVELLTIKALLTETALPRLSIGPHRFCPDPSCAVVYFDANGTVYSTGDLRVPVWQKQAFGQRAICYCFGESETGMRAEIEATGRSDAAGRVRSHIAAGRCACDVRNPRGACCLGDLMAAIERVHRSLRDASAVVR